MYTTFEERQKINDLFEAEYYGFNVNRKINSLVVTAYENDKKTVKGTYYVTPSFQFGLPSCYPQLLPRETFLLGVSVCMVDGEPAYFIGVDDQHYAPDDRQYFAVIPMDDDDEGCIKRVNDIDNFITLLAPVMDAQALYQPTEEDDDNQGEY
jgi:hypothetical protein